MNAVQRMAESPWALLDDLSDFQRELNRFFDTTYRPSVFPPVNVWVSESNALVDVELPGASAEDLNISVLGDQLTVKGEVKSEATATEETHHRRERQYGPFERSVVLPFRAAADGIRAVYRNGVLRITVPRAPEDQPRKIRIEAA